MRPVFFYKPLPPQPRPAGWRWWFNVWTPVAIAIAIICIESTNTLSAKNTSSWLRPIFEHIFGAISDSAWDLFHHILRKSGHFLGYGTVGLTFLRAWLYTLDWRRPRTLLRWRIQSSVLAVLSTAFVASCDEYHQTFLPDRTGTAHDVLLDTAGATALCLLVWLICWTKRSRWEA